MAKPYLINPDLQPNEDNPHTWLALSGSEPGTPGPRIMTGTLRPVHRQFRPTCVAFGRAKIQPVPAADGDPWAITAARAEVLLPAGADDRYACPRTLLEEADALATGPADPLLAYVTFSWMPGRLHEMYEEVRQFVREEIISLGCPVLLVQHAPHRARSANLPHVHALAIPSSLTQLGWSARVSRLTGDKGRTFVVGRWEAFRERRARTE